MKRRPYLIIGHRGVVGFEGIVENTLPAFAKAFELGADLVELDVWKTTDEVLMVKHDAQINCHHTIVDLTCEEVKKFDYANGAKVPTLQEVIEQAKDIKGEAALYIEVKDKGCERALIDLLRENKITAQVIVGSFHYQVVEKVKKMDADVRTSFLFTSTNEDCFNVAQRIGANFVHPCWEGHPNPHLLLTPELCQRCRQLKLGVITWHEERREQIVELVKKPVFAICTDQPQLLL